MQNCEHIISVYLYFLTVCLKEAYKERFNPLIKQWFTINSHQSESFVLWLLSSLNGGLAWVVLLQRVFLVVFEEIIVVLIDLSGVQMVTLMCCWDCVNVAKVVSMSINFSIKQFSLLTQIQKIGNKNISKCPVYYLTWPSHSGWHFGRWDVEDLYSL